MTAITESGRHLLGIRRILKKPNVSDEVRKTTRAIRRALPSDEGSRLIGERKGWDDTSFWPFFAGKRSIAKRRRQAGYEP